MWETWREQVDFLVVYIREAHPEEGWVVTPNRDEGIVVNDPTTTDERVEVAASCAINLKIRMPVTELFPFRERFILKEMISGKIRQENISGLHRVPKFA